MYDEPSATADKMYKVACTKKYPVKIIGNCSSVILSLDIP